MSFGGAAVAFSRASRKDSIRLTQLGSGNDTGASAEGGAIVRARGKQTLESVNCCAMSESNGFPTPLERAQSLHDDIQNAADQIDTDREIPVLSSTR